MSVDLSAQQEPTISVITTVPVAQNGGEMDALLLGRIGVSTQNNWRNIENILTTQYSILKEKEILQIPKQNTNNKTKPKPKQTSTK